MTAYFLGVITVTLLSVLILFAVTVGKPLSRDIHSLLRNHIRYLALLVSDEYEGEINSVCRSLDRFSDLYGFKVALLDKDRNPLFLSRSMTGRTDGVTDVMIEKMDDKGLFVQKGHFGKPIIYAMAVHQKDKGRCYLILSKEFPELKVQRSFMGGLFMIGGLMMVAVYPLSRGISRPVTQLTRALENISNGNFNDTPVCERRDEIGELVQVYKTMSESVNHMIASKKQLMADISHELCSPLARIRVGTELVKDMTDDERVRRYVGSIENDIGFMDHLIGNVATYSRLNLPGFPLNLAIVCPNTLVEDVAVRYEAVSVSKGIVIRRSVSSHLPDIEADPDQLKQVFTNLVDNAVRYAVHGEVVTVGAEKQDSMVCFYVEDQGPGVTEEDSKRIFEPLYRADSSRDPNAGGSGLGLAISARIMELHGGTLEYKRTDNKTKFVFCIKSK